MQSWDIKERKSTLMVVVVAIFMLLIARVGYLQLFDSRYASLSERNVIRKEIVYASRGEILDRRGEYIVQSRGCYDIRVVYNELPAEGFDTTSVCEVLSISKENLIKSLKNARMRPKAPYNITSYVSTQDKLRFDELSIYAFHSIYRTVREYPRNIGGNLLGHVGEINADQLRRWSHYRAGDYIGIGGIESAYEVELRGVKGQRLQSVDTHGAIQGAYMDGLYDTMPEEGMRLHSTIDARLQLFGEELMRGKIGAAVAIEPSTGEILMMVSSPSFDPNELVGRQRGNNYMKLLNDPRRPLFNRAVTSRYPPGSIFKMVQGLIGQQEGVLKPYYVYNCYGGFNYGSHILKCHYHEPHTDLMYAIATSCNTYFCHVFNNILKNRELYPDINSAYDKWRDYVMSFGFGRKLDSDFLSEGSGYVPESSYYNRLYRGSWSPLTVISLSIGQGELGCTPLQMANLAAIIANRGYYHIPHIIRDIEGDSTYVAQKERFKERHYTMVDSAYFEPIVQGMWDGINKDNNGIPSMAKLAGYDVCGKTGTAQNPNGEDHSTFISFAPRNNPKIAVSVYVEHGGWGNRAALPITSLIEELYLTDTIRRGWLVDYVKNLKIDYPAYEER